MQEPDEGDPGRSLDPATFDRPKIEAWLATGSQSNKDDLHPETAHHKAHFAA
jgi:hypothetical protein